jgi:trans-aconitate methyltransferase
MSTIQYNPNHQDFDAISKSYEKTSIIQVSSASMLFSLLTIKENDDVLDIGCGTGKLTKKIYDISQGNVVGIDASLGMINEAKKNYGEYIRFENVLVENITFENEFDVIFSNAAFHWIKNYKLAIQNCFTSLRKNGIIGIQIPATDIFSPNYAEALEEINKLDIIKNKFSKFKNPWFYFNSADEYSNLFADKGFEIILSKIQAVETYYTPEDVYTIFCSGAKAAYLNKVNYDCRIDSDYIQAFLENIKKAFVKQAIHNGKLKLIFNRLFLIAKKP